MLTRKIAATIARKTDNRPPTATHAPTSTQAATTGLVLRAMPTTRRPTTPGQSIEYIMEGATGGARTAVVKYVAGRGPPPTPALTKVLSAPTGATAVPVVGGSPR